MTHEHLWLEKRGGQKKKKKTMEALARQCRRCVDVLRTDTLDGSGAAASAVNAVVTLVNAVPTGTWRLAPATRCNHDDDDGAAAAAAHTPTAVPADDGAGAAVVSGVRVAGMLLEVLAATETTLQTLDRVVVMVLVETLIGAPGSPSHVAAPSSAPPASGPPIDYLLDAVSDAVGASLSSTATKDVRDYADAV